MSGTIGGGVVLGVSMILSVIFAIIVVYCFKNNNVNSNVNEQHAMPHRHQYGNNRARGKPISSHEIATVSGKHQYGHHLAYQQRPYMAYDTQKQSLAVQHMALGDSMNSNSGRHLSVNKSSPSLNQSNGSLAHQNQQAIVTTHMERNNRRRP